MPKSRYATALAVLALSATAALHAGTPVAVPVTGAGVTGQVLRYAAMTSRYVDPRNVDVWLPPGYGEHPDRRYPVLYMHDGQNVFDPATAYGGVDWAVDETMTRLIAAGEVRGAIVVGIWNTPKRMPEYMPQRPVKTAPSSSVSGVVPDLMTGDIVSDRYLAFLVEELKPFVDATFRTLPDRANTSIMGSSMGGLISQYAVSRYPDVFGGAGCVSTHWPAGQGLLVDDFAQHLPEAATHRYYFDFGTATLDAEYEPYQRRVDEILRKAGYVEGRNWLTRKFPGAGHSEQAWRLRVDEPLRFLIGR